jgi:hypothetical protein
MKRLALVALLALGACSKEHPATETEKQALAGFEARAQLLQEHAAMVTSDTRVVALLNDAVNLGASNARLLESVRARTQLAQPALVQGVWIEAAALSSSTVTERR